MIGLLLALLVLRLVFSDNGKDSQCSAVEGECQTALGHSLKEIASTAGCDIDMESSQNFDIIDCIFTKSYPSNAVNIQALRKTESGPREMTYGELRPVAFSRLLNGDGLAGLPAEFSDVFVDLGSGTGKLPLQAFLHGLGVAKGVELAVEHHDFAAKGMTGLAKFIPSGEVLMSPGHAHLSLGARHVNVSQGNMLTFPLAGSTIVFAASLCFPPDLLESVAAKVRQELAPGSFFWSLKELPVGKHVGLALVGKLSTETSWSVQSPLLVYVRVPDVLLPPFPQDSSEPLESRNTWARSVIDIAHSEFQRLRELSGGAMDESGLLHGDAFSAAAMHLQADTLISGERLLRTFGTPNPRSDDDQCGCLDSSREEWSLAEVDFAGMLLHAAFPSSMNHDLDTACLSMERSCSAGDRIAEYIFEFFRKREVCEEQPHRPVCKDLASGQAHPLNFLDRYECLRTSDSRSLLHHALFRDKRSFALQALRGSGNASWLCRTREGQGGMHLAARHANSRTMKWALGKLADLGDLATKALDTPDGFGRTPLSLAHDVENLEALIKAGCSKAGINAVDKQGGSPLYHAVFRGDEEMVTALLRLGANVSSTDDPNTSPLIAAAKKRGSAGSRLVQLLVAHRADLHATHGAMKTTALHISAASGHLSTVKALLDLGARPDAVAYGGMRAHELARDSEIIELLNASLALSA